MITTNHPNAATLSKVFKSGNSQAVRIPASLRLDTDEVKITKLADGKLLIEPIFDKDSLSKGQLLLSVLSGFDSEFVEALEDSKNNPLPMQERESL